MTRQPTPPVLGIGGAHSLGNQVGHDEARCGRRADPGHPGCAHWVAEETPEEALAALTAFLAPYRDGRGAQPQDA